LFLGALVLPAPGVVGDAGRIETGERVEAKFPSIVFGSNPCLESAADHCYRPELHGGAFTNGRYE
jgi:hypothetical protein